MPSNSSLKSVRQLSATAIVKLTDLVASTLPVRSVERNSIVYIARLLAADRRLVVSVQSPPLTRYSVMSTPLPPASSVAVSVTVTGRW